MTRLTRVGVALAVLTAVVPQRSSAQAAHPGLHRASDASSMVGAEAPRSSTSTSSLFGPTLDGPARRLGQVDADDGVGGPLGPAGLSLLVPGVGQHVLGQGRKWIYAALEVAGWVVFLERRAAGNDYRERYRDFAWDQARIQTGSRIDGSFDYYETLTKWTASGLFDADPSQAGVQPEMDPATYNGAIWALATQIFVPGGGPVSPTDPGYQSALAYYTERAYGTPFLWDWSGAPGGQARLGELIEETDDRFRQATTALGVVIANHLVSAVDAYLSARGRSAPARLTFQPVRSAAGTGWSAALSVPVGR